MTLSEYVRNHTERGACQCGRCIDKGNYLGTSIPAPNDVDTRHSVNVGFFDVSLKADPSAAEFIQVVREHQGCFGEVDLLDGKEHGYMELGGWAGDQGLALLTMALGSLLGVWKLLTPKTVLGSLISDDQAMQLAGQGMVTIQAPQKEAAIGA